jgi:hypothetical protein
MFLSMLLCFDWGRNNYCLFCENFQIVNTEKFTDLCSRTKKHILEADKNVICFTCLFVIEYNMMLVDVQSTFSCEK